MNIFEKGEYKPIPSAFRIQGLAALQELTKFQQQFEIFDTDTTIRVAAVIKNNQLAK